MTPATTTPLDDAGAGFSGVRLLGVTRRYGDVVVLANMDLDLETGTVTAVMGPNGCGKTTLGRVVLGLDAPDEGEVEGLTGKGRAAVFQEDRLCSQLSARDNVRLVLPRSDWDQVNEHLRLVGLTGRLMAQPVSELSGGQRRRVALIRALAGNAQVVVLDEPFAGIDTEVIPQVLQYVKDRARDKAVMLITHDTAHAKVLGARVVRLPALAVKA